MSIPFYPVHPPTPLGLSRGVGQPQRLAANSFNSVSPAPELMSPSTKQGLSPDSLTLSQPTTTFVASQPSVKPHFQGTTLGKVLVWYFSAPKGCGYFYAEETINSPRKVQKKHEEIERLALSRTEKDLAKELVTIRYLHPRRDLFGREEAYKQHCRTAAKLIAQLDFKAFQIAQRKLLTAVATVKTAFSDLDKAKKALEKANKVLGKLPKSASNDKIQSAQKTIDDAKAKLEKAEEKAQAAEKVLQDSNTELAEVRKAKRELFHFLSEGLGLTRKKFVWKEVRGDADPDELERVIKAGLSEMMAEIDAFLRLKAALEKANPKNYF